MSLFLTVHASDIAEECSRDDTFLADILDAVGHRFEPDDLGGRDSEMRDWCDAVVSNLGERGKVLLGTLLSAAGNVG